MLDRETERLELVPTLLCLRARSIRVSGFPRSHGRPMITATAREAPNRAATMSKRPGKATAVDTNTMGLMAGAASMKARAAPGTAPAATSRPEMGTDPHSHPGRSTPAVPAAHTEATRFLGRSRAMRSGVTYAAMIPLMTTPPYEERKGLEEDRHQDGGPRLQFGAVCHRRHEPPHHDRSENCSHHCLHPAQPPARSRYLGSDGGALSGWWTLMADLSRSTDTPGGGGSRPVWHRSGSHPGPSVSQTVAAT
ncbi:hypothetical protein BH23ACT5_BH23ACT5_12230 [soil metagenome]